MPANYRELISDGDWARRAAVEDMHGVVTSQLVLKHGATLLVHEFDGFGQHRLWAGATCSGWTSHESIARADKFAATSDYFSGLLPTIFKLEVVRASQIGASK